ncbi:MAG: hypothetical protein JWN66_4949 [Sphingomonas bacterium]|uniref:hypothetical protein n=1 Tax=Sphingomonas bacterium TaxID=1895847 RepID=UPI002613CD47|nr:hypothetical protein [Sphingomonas bacterium]MDB5707833.1 hypothetical protein [Sphingomonas bacterium]
MSVQCNSYVLFGVILPYESINYERAEPYLDSAFEATANPSGNITVLLDGMSGEYAALGHVVQKTANFEGFPAPISIDDFPTSDINQWAADIMEAMIAIGIPTAPHRFGWHVVSHYR